MIESIPVVILFLSSVNCDCGYPGYSRESRLVTGDDIPAGSTLSSFRERETVHYRCQHDADIIIGNLNRTCINNEWTGVVPKCGKF